MSVSRGVALGFAAVVCATSFAAVARARGGASPAPPAPPKPVPAGWITGTVVDEEGKPVAGAEVIAVQPSTEGTWKAATDARGLYAIRGVPAGEATVVVRARSRVPVESKAKVLARGPVTVNATLRLGVRFAGKVTDMRGAPIPGAVVEAVPASGSGGFRFVRVGQGMVKSGPDGSFEADGLEPGENYDVRVTHPRFALAVLPGLPAEAGSGHGALDVVMEDAAWMRGVVVDPSGKPVPSASVSLAEDTGAYGGMPLWVWRMFQGVVDAGTIGGPTCDAQGRFELGGLTEPEAEVTAIADGFFRTTWKVEGLEPGKGKEDVKITLEPATAWIEGKVVDAEGKPIAGANLVAHGDEGTAAQGKTDAQGAFRLVKVRSRTPVRLTASAEGRSDATMTDVALNSGGLSLTLQLSPRLKARLVDEAGKIVASVELSISTRMGERQFAMHHMSLDQGEAGIDVPLPIGDVTVDARGPKGVSARVGEWTTEPAGVVDAGTVTLSMRGKPAKPEPEPEEDEEE
jgi:protocatechuate 3,4-dioxygenase beta subunit